jgi:hypothetical protein
MYYVLFYARHTARSVSDLLDLHPQCLGALLFEGLGMGLHRLTGERST